MGLLGICAEDNDALSPDFKGVNDTYLQLFDERDPEEFTTKCADIVINFLDR